MLVKASKADNAPSSAHLDVGGERAFIVASMTAPQGTAAKGRRAEDVPCIGSGEETELDRQGAVCDRSTIRTVWKPAPVTAVRYAGLKARAVTYVADGTGTSRSANG